MDKVTITLSSTIAGLGQAKGIAGYEEFSKGTCRELSSEKDPVTYKPLPGAGKTN
ncbi:MAG: hypothetical protein ACYS8X_05070 [Planctomycetota bacterium]|jgi:hypothetical protein